MIDGHDSEGGSEVGGNEPRPSEPAFEPDTTFRLLDQARGGDRAALEQVCRRYLPRLRRWAAGRLPRGARDLVDTEDLVQEVLAGAMQRVDRFDYRGQRAFQAYVYQALRNRLLNLIERCRRQPLIEEMPANQRSLEASPLEQVVGRELLEQYEAALTRLPPVERDALVGRLELGLSYRELAESLERPSDDAARKLVSRALVRLAREMGRAR